MNNHKIVSREEWVETRKQFLVQEKEFSEHRGRGRGIRVTDAMSGGQKCSVAYQAE